MPLYYFDLDLDGERTTDAFGADLDSFAEAAEQASAILADIAREELPAGDVHDFAIKVRDQSSTVVYEASLIYRGGRPPLGAAASAAAALEPR